MHIESDDKATGRPTASTSAIEPSALGLRKIRLLEHIPPAALQDLARQCRWRSYRARQAVITREAPDTDVYFIISGNVRVTAFSASGRQVTFGDVEAGEWFGDFAAIDGHARSADVVALQDSFIASITPGVFRALLHEHPSACDCMLRRLVSSVRDLSERIFDFSTLGVQNRVHAELLRLAKRAGVYRNRASIDPAPKHADIASQISTNREQVTRELSAMVKQGILRRAGRALIVADVARLEKLVSDVRRSA
jgi:CRP-like cAMP-binding protein